MTSASRGPANRPTRDLSPVRTGVWALVAVMVALTVSPAVAAAALPGTGIVVAWGHNGFGQARPPARLSGVTAIAAGFYHGLAARSDGTVVGWGSNSAGQATVPVGLRGVTAVAAGAAHSLALKSDGTVVAWGDNTAGQATVPTGLSGVTAIAAGADYSLALTSTGGVVSWGAVHPGAPPPDWSVTAIAAGDVYNLALYRGLVYPWGDTTSGGAAVPTGLSGVTAIAAGIGHALAVLADSTVVAWGDNSSGQSNVPPGLRGVTAVAGGLGYSLALKSDGTVVAWGDNTAGQATVPAGLGRVFGLAAKYGFSLALRTDTTPPVLQVPAGVNATGTGPSGTPVTYQVSASDVDDTVTSVSCSPGSGTTFAVGTTTVRCTATDSSGNTGFGRFTITVAQPPVPATTAATTTAPRRTTRPATSSSTTAPATTTTSTAAAPASGSPPADPPPAPPPAAAPGGGPTLVVAAAGRPGWGSAGSNLRLSGSGYANCRTVFFFFDSARVGSATPDARGVVAEAGLSVPGDASVGRHQVTSSCEASGRAVERTATFKVVGSSAHRTAFVTSLPSPGQVSTSPAVLAVSAAVALGIIPLLAFPSQLFNSTLQENYDEISGWLAAHRAHRRRPPPRARGKLAQTAQFGGFLLTGAVLYGLLTPGFGFNRTSLALAAGLVLALLVICVGFSVPTLTYMRRRFGDRGRLRILPGTILVAVACVGLSRLLHFQPGALYGLLAVFVFGRDLDKQHKGRLSAVSAAFILTVSVGAWFLRVPVASAAGRPGAGLGVLILDAALSAIFLLGLESLVISLLPLRFLDGSNVMAWNRVVWAVLFGAGVFAVFHVLLRPGSGYVGHSSAGSLVVVGAFYVAFGLLSVGFWAYFRFRPQPLRRYEPAGMAVGLTE